MFKFIRRWWKVKKMSRAIWRQVKIEQTRSFTYEAEAVEHVHKCLKELGLTDKDMQARCMSSLPPVRNNNVIKEDIKCQ